MSDHGRYIYIYIFIYIHTYINSFWANERNKLVIDCLKKFSSRYKAKSLSTFDFSTKIPHDRLLAVLNEFVDFAFLVVSKSYECQITSLRSRLNKLLII